MCLAAEAPEHAVAFSGPLGIQLCCGRDDLGLTPVACNPDRQRAAAQGFLPYPSLG